MRPSRGFRVRTRFGLRGKTTVLRLGQVLVRPDLMQVLWARMQAGDFISEAVQLIDTSRRFGRRILIDSGGVRSRRGRDLKERCLTPIGVSTKGQRQESVSDRPTDQMVSYLLLTDREIYTSSRDLSIT